MNWYIRIHLLQLKFCFVMWIFFLSNCQLGRMIFVQNTGGWSGSSIGGYVEGKRT
jgi:hypothetical protein